jgi:hypothetical protein
MKRNNLLAASVVALLFLALAIKPLQAQNGNVWSIAFYANPDWAGEPVMGMQSSYIDFNWGTAPPGPGMPATDWTATMTSSAYFYYSGTYIFQALADDEVSVQIDGVTYINTIGAGMSGKTVQVGVPLAQGTHNLVVQYRQATGSAYVYVTWAYANPGGSYPYTPVPAPMPAPPPPAPATLPAPVPACDPSWSCSCPAEATSVTTQYGDYTPCIEQNLHQSACFQSDGQWDSPNTGSIETEPQIEVWGNCTPSTLQCMQLTCNQEPVEATCSKTAAGWFYYGACPAPE